MSSCYVFTIWTGFKWMLRKQVESLFWCCAVCFCHRYEKWHSLRACSWNEKNTHVQWLDTVCHLWGEGISFNLGAFVAYGILLNHVWLLHCRFCKHFEGTVTENCWPFMKPEDSLPHFQELVTVPCLQSDEFSLHPFVLFLWDTF
jgi:hypothetical protein